MLVHEGDRRSLRIDLKLATALACAAGASNAAGFQAAGLFSANMTGNVSALSDQIGLGRFGPAALFAVLVAAFVGGALCSGVIMEQGRKRARGSYATCVLIEAALLAMLGLATLLIPELDLHLLPIGLSFAMGMQNAATTQISDARVRTTHVSGMATDIGLGIAALLHAKPGPRFILSCFTLFAFLFGGIAGAMGYVMIGGWLFVMIGAALVAVALPAARYGRMLSPPQQ